MIIKVLLICLSFSSHAINTFLPIMIHNVSSLLYTKNVLSAIDVAKINRKYTCRHSKGVKYDKGDDI